MRDKIFIFTVDSLRKSWVQAVELVDNFVDGVGVNNYTTLSYTHPKHTQNTDLSTGHFAASYSVNLSFYTVSTPPINKTNYVS